MKTKEFSIKRNSVNSKERTLEAVLTERMVDRDSEVVEPAGARLENFKKNPVMPWGHQSFDPPIGYWSDIKQTKERITAKGHFLPEGKSARADEVFACFETGVLRSFSIGFDPIAISDETVLEGQKGATITDWELLEASPVTIPANPGSLVKAFGLVSRENPQLVNKQTVTDAYGVILALLEKAKSGESLNDAEKLVLDGLTIQIREADIAMEEEGEPPAEIMERLFGKIEDCAEACKA